MGQQHCHCFRDWNCRIGGTFKSEAYGHWTDFHCYTLRIGILSNHRLPRLELGSPSSQIIIWKYLVVRAFHDHRSYDYSNESIGSNHLDNGSGLHFILLNELLFRNRSAAVGIGLLHSAYSTLEQIFSEQNI